MALDLDVRKDEGRLLVYPISDYGPDKVFIDCLVIEREFPTRTSSYFFDANGLLKRVERLNVGGVVRSSKVEFSRSSDFELSSLPGVQLRAIVNEAYEAGRDVVGIIGSYSSFRMRRQPQTFRTEAGTTVFIYPSFDKDIYYIAELLRQIEETGEDMVFKLSQSFSLFKDTSSLRFLPQFAREEYVLPMQVYIGCPRASRCVHCTDYEKRGENRAKTIDEAINDFERMRAVLSREFGRYKEIFLLDANALVVPNLEDFLNYINQKYPGFRRHQEGYEIIGGFGSFTDVQTILRWDEDILSQYLNLGLCKLNIGVESGSKEVLDFLEKGTDRDRILKALEKAKKIGFWISINILTNLWISSHEPETISLLDLIAEEDLCDMVYFSELKPSNRYIEKAKEWGVPLNGDHNQGPKIKKEVEAIKSGILSSNLY